ncbi:ABC transporter ATP-binding protein [Microlunatus sp. GCM10028923]|uniref:ABC transporter ATP-binding protein n=1 Tax=Microlunatus sp. GCM10028923 TaxID=3273400 RepID=UPI00360D186C
MWFLVRALPGRVALQLFLAALSGTLPAIFSALLGLLVGLLPEVIRGGGLGTPAGDRLILLLAAVALVLVAQDLASSTYELAKWAFYRRYEHYLLARVINATVGTRRLELFENPRLAQLADRAVRMAGDEPGDLVDGWCCRWQRLAEGLAATVLVATVWPLAAVPLAVIWLVAGLTLMAAMRRLNFDLWTSELRSASYLGRIAERTEWAKEVRIFGLIDWLADRFGGHWASVLAGLAKVRRVGRGRAIGALLLIIVGHAVVLGAVATGVGGGLTPAQLTVLLLGLLGMAALADPMADQLIDFGTPKVRTMIELERAAGTVEPIRSPGAGRPPGRGPVREIRFEDVAFGYPGTDRPVFERLSLTIRAGTSLGIVGLNGAGKTTLIKLLAGLERPDRGRITVDGRDLAELPDDEWRRTIAAIFQDYVHYQLSARDNIAFGAVERLADPAALDDLVRRSAGRTGADEVLAALPHGLDTPLSRRFSGGVDLSGGQWQRIALARALAAVENGARVLILDEPTAQLDVRAEADVYDRFLDLTRDLTTIVISHRFSTVRRADRIVVLDGGRITEQGSHDELVAAGGSYARLFATQAAAYQQGAADAE